MAAVTADIAAVAGTAANMPQPPTLRADTVTAVPRPAMLRADTLVSVLAVDVVTILRGPRAARRALQDAHIIGIAAVTGEAITGIRPMDILGSVITAWAIAIHTTGLAITVTPGAGAMIRTTDISRADTTLTATDTGRT
jgi:hypothetical protein